MKTILKGFALTVTISAILISCHKEPAATPAGGSYASISDFINKNGAAVQSFTVDGAAGGTFTGSQGTVFYFPPSAFVNSQNQAVTGTVNISLREIYASADMVFSNKPSTANNNTVPLLSGGEFYITATQNGQTLLIAPGNYYSAHMPNADLPQGMQVYTANTVNTNNVVNWAANPADSTENIIFADTTAHAVFFGDSMNWVNCDGVYPDPSGQYYSITAVPVNCPDITQTQVYVMVNNKMAVWQLNAYGTGQFTTPGDIVPNAPLTIVAICVSGGKVYSAFTPVTVTNSNLTVNLNFALTTDTIFKTQVRAIL